MRLELSRKSDLAVRALCVLSGADRVKARDLAEAIDTTPTFLTQVMAPLVRAGWIRSDRGPTGGYELATPLAEISMLDLLEATEGAFDRNRCALRGGPCADGDVCALHDAWVPARDSLLSRLAATSVAVGCGGSSRS